MATGFMSSELYSMILFRGTFMIEASLEKTVLRRRTVSGFLLIWLWMIGMKSSMAFQA